MATKKLRYLLLILEHILQRIRSWPTKAAHALSVLFRRILVWWALARSKIRFGTRDTRGKALQSPPKDDGPKEPQQSSSMSEGGTTSTEIIPYTMAKQGESVRLDDNGIAFALNPYTSARKSGNSAQILQAQRSSHNLSVISHNASRSSHFLGSEFSHPASSTRSDRYIFQVQRSPTNTPNSPYGPHRQFSASEPHIGSPGRRAMELPPLESIHLHSVPSTERFSDIGTPQAIEMTRSSSPAPRYLDNARITPVMPEATRRYDRRGTVDMDECNLVIPPLKFTFTQPHAPGEWIRIIHPEGARYFYHPHKRIYTDTDLFDEKLYSQLIEDIAEIRRHISSNEITLPVDSLMFIDTEWVDGQYATTYYFIDHTTRSIFYLDSFSANTMYGFGEVWGCSTELQLGHEIEAQYWFFIQLYPDALPITSDCIAELRDVTLHFIGDNMSSAYSVSPYNQEDLLKIVGLTNQLEKNVGKKCLGATSLLGRFMYLFAHARFQNYHGEGCARLERDVSVHKTPMNQRTWLIKILAPILFSAPDVHLRLLRKTYVDGMLKLAVWDTSMKKMNEEWQEFILFATVLLNANVAFLAIQSIDTDVPVDARKPAQIASYLSTIASIGSIILGLLLIRQHRTKHRETASDVSNFLARRQNTTRGMEMLAILYSLPYALLMWGMVSFLVAFCLVCFENANTSTRAITSSAFAAVTILIAWCVWSAWESQPDQAPSAEEPQPTTDEKNTSSEGLGGFGELNGKPFMMQNEVLDSNGPPATTGGSATGPSGGKTWTRWMPGLKIFNLFRKGTFDSEKTAV